MIGQPPSPLYRFFSLSQQSFKQPVLTFTFTQVVRDKRTGKTRGYGFVSFGNPADLAAALKEMNGVHMFLLGKGSMMIQP